MNRCESKAELISRGRLVGALWCELDVGHRGEHVATLHWEDGEVISDDDDGPGVDVPFE